VMLSVLGDLDKVMAHKQIVLCQALASLLQIEDSLQQTRVSWAMTPFPIALGKYQPNSYSSKTSGILVHLKK